jgi:hypothetical protein
MKEKPHTEKEKDFTDEGDTMPCVTTFRLTLPFTFTSSLLIM